MKLIYTGQAVVEYYEDVDHSYWYEYRYSNGQWSILMGQSWECCDSEENELNELRKEIKNEQSKGEKIK